MVDEDKETRRVRAADELNGVFDKVRAISEEQVSAGATQLDTLKVLQDAGVAISEGALKDLGVPPRVDADASKPWNEWFPWRPIWSHLWSQHDPGSTEAHMYIPN